MSRKTSTLAGLAGAATVAATLTALVFPTSGAGAGSGCTAWGTLPPRVVLGPNGATVRTTLQGTAGCRGVTADSGATALLQAPRRSDDVPMRWSRFGDSDQAVYYPTLDRPGTYRLVNGRTQTYDSQYVRIPSAWRSTSTVVKYRGRFAGVGRDASGVSATLQSYGAHGWTAQANDLVWLQRRGSNGSWQTVASAHTSSSGHVRIDHRLSSGAAYRLVGATTSTTWAPFCGLSTAGV